MDIIYKAQHFAHRTLLMFLGPADLADHADPRQQLKREYAARYGKPMPGSATVPAQVSAAEVPAAEVAATPQPRAVAS